MIKQSSATTQKHFSRIIFVLILLILSLAIISLFENPIIPIHPKTEGDFPDEVLWELRTDDMVISPVLIKNGYGYAITKKKLYVFNIQDGQISWTMPITAYKNYSAPPELFEDYFVFQNSPSGATIISLTSQTTLWSCEKICSGTELGNGHEIMDYLLHDSIFYVVRYNSKLSADDIRTGETLWSINIPDRVHISIDFFENKLLMSNDKKLSLLDPSSGSVVNEVTLGDYIGNFFIEEGSNNIIVYTPLGINILTNYEYPSMKVNWSINSEFFSSSKINTSYPSSATFINGNFIFYSNRILFIDQIEGKVIWFSESQSRFEKPSISDDILYSRNTSGSIYAIDLNTGKTLGKLYGLPPEQIIRGGPIRSLIIFNNLLISPLGNDRIISLGL